MNKSISVEFLSEAEKFLDSLDEKSRKKVFFNIRKTEEGIKGEWFRDMPGRNDLWEFRTLFNQKHLRMLAFWDTTGNEKTLIVCTNGFIKKTDKTPPGEIDKAERLKKAYFDSKKNKKK